MKILVVSNMYPSADDPSYGTFIRNFYEDLAARNRDGQTSLTTIRGRRRSKVAKLAAYASYYTRLTTRLLFGRYDLIYVHTVTFPTPALRLATLFRRLPVVYNVHGDDVLPSNKMKTVLRNMATPLLAKARMIVAPSEYFKGVVAEVFPAADRDKIFVSPSGGVNKGFFSRKTHVNTGDTPLVLGYVSRIDPGKGWETYLQAIKKLKDNGIDCRGIMAGGGSQAGELRRMIADNGLADTVEYLGPLSQPELMDLNRRFDLFIFPTRRKAESLGLVGIEAMAAGVPVIASAMAGATSYVCNGRNGFLFTPGSADDLAKKIMEYASLTPQRKQELSDNAHSDAEEYETGVVSQRLFKKISTLV